MKKILVRGCLLLLITPLLLIFLVFTLRSSSTLVAADSTVPTPITSLPPFTTLTTQAILTTLTTHTTLTTYTNSSSSTDITSPPKPHPFVNSTNSSGTETTDSFLAIFKEDYVYDKFTIVMPTFKRTENLFLVMDQYCSFTDIIDRIMILWNNIGSPIPRELSAKAESCAVLVIIRVMEKNNLTSRFFPYSQIRTAGIMSLDDDNLISKPSLELAFRTFQKYPYRLIGYDARGFSVRDNKHYHYSFKSYPYTVVLTNRAFIHYRYLQLFSKIPKKVRDFVVDHKNGEDLAMNVVVGKYLKEMGRGQCVGVRIKTTIKALNNISKENYGGLSRRSSHISDRHKCFQLLADTYGDLRDYLPECTLVISDQMR